MQNYYFYEEGGSQLLIQLNLTHVWWVILVFWLFSTFTTDFILHTNVVYQSQAHMPYFSQVYYIYRNGGILKGLAIKGLKNTITTVCCEEDISIGHVDESLFIYSYRQTYSCSVPTHQFTQPKKKRRNVATELLPLLLCTSTLFNAQIPQT